MATNLMFKKAQNEGAMFEFLKENDIDNTDIVAFYCDTASNMPVIWYINSITDTTGPALRHTNINNGQQAGVVVPVYVQAPQEVEVKGGINLYFRTTGAGSYEGPVALELQPDGVTWLGYIDAGSVASPGVQYYIYAEDPDSNATELGTAGSPLTFTV